MEIWDLCDGLGRKTGETWERGRAREIPEDRVHMVCDVLIRHRDGDFLLTLRDPGKDVYPGCLEASAGGSALAGETPEQAARREMLEETGLAAEKLRLISTARRPESRSIICAWLAVVDCEKDSVRLQPGETVDYRWVGTPEFLRLIREEPVLRIQYPRYKPYLDTLQRPDRQDENPERLYFEIPGPEREADAFDFIREFYACGSDLNGTGGLQHFPEDYPGWLEKLNGDYTRKPGEERVPARTFFLVREGDRRIVGMINIRLCLNERLRRFGGHIGYSIRPTERGRGYNKINLYLALKLCDARGIEKVFMDADLGNPASWRTMEALGGVRLREYYDGVYARCTVVDYEIDVKKALAEHPEFEALTCGKVPGC